MAEDDRYEMATDELEDFVLVTILAKGNTISNMLCRVFQCLLLI